MFGPRKEGRGRDRPLSTLARLRLGSCPAHPSVAPFSLQGLSGACWRAWPAGATCRPGARGLGTCSVQAPGSCTSLTERAASRRPWEPRVCGSAARAAPPLSAAQDCAPARPSRMSARQSVSPEWPQPIPGPSLAPLTVSGPILQPGYPLQGTGDSRTFPGDPRHPTPGN